MQTSLAQHYTSLLQQTWRDMLGPAAFGRDGRLVDWRSGLLPSLVDLAEGDVTRLFDPARLRQPQTAGAMALNSFLPWRDIPERLRFAGHGPFSDLRFLARCPTGVRGTPPILELLANKGADLVAVSARGADYLAHKPARLAPAYEAMTWPEAMAGWQRLMSLLEAEPGRYRHLDAISLLKNAIGLARTFPGYRVTLVYLFWEPESADALAFHRHRSEIKSVAEMVAGSRVAFSSLSFEELWAAWERSHREPWLREMVAEWRARYAVAIDAPSVL